MASPAQRLEAFATVEALRHPGAQHLEGQDPRLLAAASVLNGLGPSPAALDLAAELLGIARCDLRPEVNPARSTSVLFPGSCA